MLEWLVPISLFWTLIATYVGGWPVSVEGGSGLQQVIGLIATFALFLVVWGVLHAALSGSGMVLRVVIPTTICCLALPVFTWAGFRIVGVRITLHRGTEH